MKKKHVQLIIGLVISAVFLWWAFRMVDLGELWQAFLKTNLFWGAVMIVVTMASFFWRVFRWRIFLRPVKVIPRLRLFDPLMVGFGFNNIFPARAGEFARALALMKSEKVPFGAGFSTIVLERLVDVLTLLVLLIAMPVYITLNPDVALRAQDVFAWLPDIELKASWIGEHQGKLSIMALVLMAGVVSFLIPPIKRLYITILHAMPVLPKKWKDKLEGFIISFAKGFESLKRPQDIGLTAFHSIVVWFSIAFSYQVMSWGFPGVDLNFGQALTFLLFTCVAITIPSSPGYWGPFEVGGMAALIIMGVVENTQAGWTIALAFTMVAHFLQWMPTTIYGLWAAGRLHVSAADAAESAESGAAGPLPAASVPADPPSSSS